MRKRLFTLLLVSLLAVTFVPAASAIKVSDEFAQNVNNIYSLWGDFETKEQFEQAHTINDANVAAEDKTILTHIDGGAENSKKAVGVEVVRPDKKDHLNFPFGSAINEGYEVSFYLKYNSSDAENVVIDFQHLGKEDVIKLPLVKETADEWTKYTCTWTSEGVLAHVYGEPGGVTALRFYLDGAAPYSYSFDRLSVIPYKKVKQDYSKVNVHYNYEAPEELPAEPRKGNFSDIDNHWARPVIKSLAYSGYVNGNGDRTFAPDEKVTRAEFIKMAYGTLNEETIPYDGRFSDVAESSWYSDIIMSADEIGLIADELKKDGKILPNTPISREEAASIAARAAVILGPKAHKSVAFTDKAEISAWANEAVVSAAEYGVISGYDDGSFKPKNTITRAEAAQILMNLIEITGVMNIYVDAENGNDANDGSKNAPLATITAARDMTEKLAPKMQHDIYIVIRGEHYFDETFTLNEKHSGRNGYNIVYTSWDAEKAIFTMAKKYTGFELHDAAKNIYKLYVGEGTHTRQAFFNDVRGIRSRTVGYLKNVTWSDDLYYFWCDNTELLDIKYPTEVDAQFHNLWTDNTYLVESFTPDNGRVKLTLNDFWYTNMGTMNMYSFEKDRRYTPSWLENAYEFLDEEGEWYLNRHDGYMYYIPRKGEDMATMELKLPFGEHLLRGEGSSYEKSLENVTFDNILFEGTTWYFIDEKGGFVNIQNMYHGGTHNYYQTNDGETLYSTPGGTLHFEKCKNITLSNNVIRHTGDAFAIQFFDGSKNINIVGNEIYDISSGGIIIDEPADDGSPVTRTDKRSWCEYIDIANNYIHHIGQDHEGVAGISSGWPRHMKISHNEIAYATYSGLHLGWGFENYDSEGSLLYDIEISNNFIHDVMVQRVNDGSAIYTLGASSYELDTTADAPNNGANKNKNINNYLLNTWQCDCVYPDQASSSWYIANNVADVGKWKDRPTSNFKNYGSDGQAKSYWSHNHTSTIKYLTYDNNFTSHDYAYNAGYMKQSESVVDPANIYPDRNWPDEALEIIANAGITDEYLTNFDTKGPVSFIATNQWQSIQQGVPMDSSLILLDNENNKLPLSDYDVRLWCDTPGAITMDENGYITAHQSGHFECEAFVEVKGVTLHQHLMFEVFGKIEDVNIGESFSALAGFDAPVTIYGYTADGEQANLTGLPKLTADLKVENPELAEIVIDEATGEYLVKGFTRGETNITGTISYLDKKYEINVPLTVRSHGSKEAEELPYREVDFTKGWLGSNSGMQTSGGFKTDVLPSHNEQLIENELVAFDVVIEDGTGWPTIAICHKSTKDDYNKDECYMFGFKSDYIEVQKFIKGQRSYIYGNDMEALHGVGPVNTGGKILAYDKRYSVVMGALETDEGTRIILTVNGKNIVDFVDTDNPLDASGYFVSYNKSPGGTTFYPFTNIKN